MFSRVVAWLVASTGVVFGLSGLAAPDLGTTLTMGASGLAFAAMGAFPATASLRVTPAGLRYRNGRVRHIPGERVSAISVGPGSGAFYPRIALVVHRSGEASMRLTALQRAATAKNRQKLEEQAQVISEVLRLAAAAPTG